MGFRSAENVTRPITAGRFLCQLLDSDFFPDLEESIPALCSTVEEAIGDLMTVSSDLVISPQIQFMEWPNDPKNGPIRRD